MAPLLEKLSHAKLTFFASSIHLLATNLHAPTWTVQVERITRAYVVVLGSSLHYIVRLVEILNQDNLLNRVTDNEMPHDIIVADLKWVSGRNWVQTGLFYLYTSVNCIETIIRLYKVEGFYRGDV